jgi:hypothetical protein
LTVKKYVGKYFLILALLEIHYSFFKEIIYSNVITKYFLQELEADMEAVNCTCGVPVDIGKCTQPIPQGVACILYDDKVISKGYLLNTKNPNKLKKFRFDAFF